MKQKLVIGQNRNDGQTKKIWKKCLRMSHHLLSCVLPQSLLFRLYRQQLKINYNPSSLLEIKVAETAEEFNSACRILHDAYVAENFMKPHRSGMRVTKYQTLNTTHTLIAKWDGKIVATISLVGDSELGLPLEGNFEISHLRGSGRRVAEISALAIDQNYRGQHGEILIPLLKALWVFVSNHLKLDHLLIAVNPNRVAFYQAILCFKKLTSKIVNNYGFANNAPACALVLNVAEAPAIYFQTYHQMPQEKNLYSFMMPAHAGGIDIPNIQFSRIQNLTLSRWGVLQGHADNRAAKTAA